MRNMFPATISKRLVCAPLPAGCFKPSDDTPSSPAVAVLNYGYWKSEFGGDPSAMGKTIHLQNLPFTIVGVAEPRFVNLTPGNTFDLWIPLAQRPRLRAEVEAAVG